MDNPGFFKLLLVISVFFFTPDFFIQSFDVRRVEFSVNSSRKCPDDDKNPVQFLGELTKITWNRYVFSGDILIKENITGEIMYQINAQRCNINMTQCEDYDKIRVNKVCDLLKQKNRMWSELIDRTEPRLKCPLQKGTMRINNATIDLQSMSRFALSGYTWISYMQFFEEIPKTRRRRLLLCLLHQTTILENRKNARPTKRLKAIQNTS